MDTARLAAAVLVLGANLAASRASAATDAVTASGVAAVGYYSGAVGFRVTPSENMVLTRVGYLDTGPTYPVIDIWTAPNQLAASYPLPAGTGSQQVTYASAELLLQAGQQYWVTLRNGPLGSNPIVFAARTPQGAPPSGQFQVATGLTGYLSYIVDGSGDFIAESADAYYGPDFSFTLQPALKLVHSGGQVTVSWPASATGFSLQQTPSLPATTWTNVTATPVSDGTNLSVTLPASGPSGFFRLVDPSAGQSSAASPMASALSESTPSALTISQSGSGIALSWPASASGVLQQSADLASGAWTDVAATPVANGAVVSVTLPVSSSQPKMFFRLR